MRSIPPLLYRDQLMEVVKVSLEYFAYNYYDKRDACEKLYKTKRII